MRDLTFCAQITWPGTRGERRGQAETGGQNLVWSVPASMGGLGEGTSPEELLLCAVGTCYSATLSGVLRQLRLPVGNVHTRVEGTVSGYPEQARLARIVVHPVLAQADGARTSEYREATIAARDRCFIGHTLRDQVEYLVGPVVLA